jgi:hypothetical protein
MALPEHQHKIDIACIECIRIKCDKYDKLVAFVRELLKHTCCLCDGERCRCCNAKDLLREIGEDK